MSDQLIDQVRGDIGDDPDFKLDRVTNERGPEWVVTHTPTGEQCALTSYADWENFRQGLLTTAGLGGGPGDMAVMGDTRASARAPLSRGIT